MARFTTPGGEAWTLEPLTFGAIRRIETATGFPILQAHDDGAARAELLSANGLCRRVYELAPKAELKKLNIAGYEEFCEWAVRPGRGASSFANLLSAWTSAYMEFMGSTDDTDAGDKQPDPTGATPG